MFREKIDHTSDGETLTPENKNILRILMEFKSWQHGLNYMNPKTISTGKIGFWENHETKEALPPTTKDHSITFAIPGVQASITLGDIVKAMEILEGQK